MQKDDLTYHLYLSKSEFRLDVFLEATYLQIKSVSIDSGTISRAMTLEAVHDKPRAESGKACRPWSNDRLFQPQHESCFMNLGLSSVVRKPTQRLPYQSTEAVTWRRRYNGF